MASFNMGRSALTPDQEEEGDDDVQSDEALVAFGKYQMLGHLSQAIDAHLQK